MNTRSYVKRCYIRMLCHKLGSLKKLDGQSSMTITDFCGSDAKTLGKRLPLIIKSLN